MTIAEDIACIRMHLEIAEVSKRTQALMPSIVNFKDALSRLFALEAALADPWRLVSPDQPDEPVLFFSPDIMGNVSGGLIWVSGGRGLRGWRNNYAKEPPTLYIPLRELTPAAALVAAVEATDSGR